MRIRKAELSDIHTVREITAATIAEVYPHYYPKGAVEFFLAHHSDDGIAQDIQANRVFLCLDAEQKVVGTVTIRDNELCRLFVLPDQQGKGYGRELLDYAERVVSTRYSEIALDASLPARELYQKRGYRVVKFHVIAVKHGDFLCYDRMVKQLKV